MSGDERARGTIAGEGPSPREGPKALLDLAVRLPLPMLVVDAVGPAHPILIANEAFAALVGRSPAALLGRDGLRVLADGAGPDAAPVLRAALAENSSARLDLTLAHADGQPVPVSAALALVPDEAGTPTWLVATLVDGREREEIAATLERVRSQGRSREALGQLTNSVAHEFNNVLQILVGYVDGMRRRLETSEDKFIRRALARSTEASERGATLTNRLLAHARRTRPEPIVVDLNAIVAEVLARVAPALPADIALARETAPGLCPVLCDPLQVEIALEAVLANAREAMPGGGRIVVRTRAREADDAEAGVARASVIEVSDTGEGMTGEVAARSTEPFFSTRAPGRGTGLAIVQGLMRRANGHLAIETAPGAGTTVRLAFPVADVPGQEAPARIAARA